MHLPKKKRNAPSAGVNGARSRSNKKARKRGKGGGNRGNNNSVSGQNAHSGHTLYYNTETGQPSGRYINGVDIKPLFTKGKIPEKVFQRLPNVVKQWFANNPDAKIPWDTSKIRSKSSQNAKRAQKKAYIDAIVSNRVCLVTKSSENLQSQMSTASQTWLRRKWDGPVFISSLMKDAPDHSWLWIDEWDGFARWYLLFGQ